MDQAFYTRSDLNESTVISHNHYFTFHTVTHFQVCAQSIPRMRSQLFQTKSYTFLLVIEVKNNNVQLLIQLNDFVRVIYATPRKVCDVNQSVYATQVNEYSVRGDIFNSTFKYLSFFQFRNDIFLLLFQLSLDKSFVRYNNVLEFLVDFNHFEFHGLANIDIIITNRLNIDLRTR